MNMVTKEEYLQLLKDIAEGQYNTEDEEPEIPIEAWIPATPPAKARIHPFREAGRIDVSNFKKDQIKPALFKCNNIVVLDFSISILHRSDEPEKDKPDTDITMNLEVWEKRYKTPSGHPCNMDYRMDFERDKRFVGRPWLPLFNGSYGAKVPVDTVVAIIRWIQMLKRLPAFV